jgi:hypothetical protein
VSTFSVGFVYIFHASDQSIKIEMEEHIDMSYTRAIKEECESPISVHSSDSSAIQIEFSDETIEIETDDELFDIWDDRVGEIEE